MHLPHVSVSPAMDRSAMDVVAILGIFQDEDTDVTQGTQVHILTHLVFKETLIDECVEDPLGHRCNG